MNKILLPLAALAITVSSCDTSSKDSTMTANFIEYSLVTDRSNTSEPAQVSETSYSLLLNWTQNTAEISTTDLTINNQKQSFETNPMELKMGYLVQEGSTGYIDYGQFSSAANVGKGATVSNLNAGFGYVSYIYNGIYVPGFETVTGARMRLMMGYDLNDQYHVQTFWPECFYGGITSATAGSSTYSVQNTVYRIQLDFKAKTAKCVIYNPQLTAESTNLPKAVVLEDVAIVFTNTDYYLTASSPTVKILNDKGALVSSDEYSNETGEPFQVSDFTLYLTSTDLTRASISYKMKEYSVNFSGASTVQVSAAQ